MNTEPTINVLLALPQDDDTLIPRSQVPLYLPVCARSYWRLKVARLVFKFNLSRTNLHAASTDIPVSLDRQET